MAWRSARDWEVVGTTISLASLTTRMMMMKRMMKTTRMVINSERESKLENDRLYDRS